MGDKRRTRPGRPEELEAPRGLRSTRFRVGDVDMMVLSYPQRLVQLPDVLTQGERDVVRCMLCGHSNAEIADARGTSVRTVANQVASIFGKVGVNSRAELILRVTRARDEGVDE